MNTSPGICIPITSTANVRRPSLSSLQMRCLGDSRTLSCSCQYLERTLYVRTPTRRVASLVSGSGFCALVYQIGWLREFRLIFGASTAASSAVLAIFIGGLGAGGLLLGSRADPHPPPLLFYAMLA